MGKLDTINMIPYFGNGTRLFLTPEPEKFAGIPYVGKEWVPYMAPEGSNLGFRDSVTVCLKDPEKDIGEDMKMAMDLSAQNPGEEAQGGDMARELQAEFERPKAPGCSLLPSVRKRRDKMVRELYAEFEGPKVPIPLKGYVPSLALWPPSLRRKMKLKLPVSQSSIEKPICKSLPRHSTLIPQFTSVPGTLATSTKLHRDADLQVIIKTPDTNSTIYSSPWHFDHHYLSVMEQQSSKQSTTSSSNPTLSLSNSARNPPQQGQQLANNRHGTSLVIAEIIRIDFN
ncbi:hypothetical protein RRF57_004898 [Xylaria bambusicola]|uniref:Uncharacterized protein n=1 Tax=Xylaria bambusicola TaxID=326684 RepID=A0AAN7Z779_9PEZI